MKRLRILGLAGVVAAALADPSALGRRVLIVGGLDETFGLDRATGEVFYGRVPPYSVVVPGTLPQRPDRPSLYCAVIVKRVDARTRAKTSINELLRD